LSGAEFKLYAEPGRELLLKESMSGIKGYDFILIDCPPSLGLLTVNALTWAKDIIIVLQPEFAPLEGVANLVDTIKVVKQRLNKHIEIIGVVITMYDSRIRLHKEVIEEVTSHFGNKVYETKIARRSIIAEAPSHGKTIFEYANKKDAAVKDFTELTEEFIRRSAK
jgi:chromosome partitioning protein